MRGDEGTTNSKPTGRAGTRAMRAAILCAGIASFPLPAAAADHTTRSSARALATEGVEAYQAGDFGQATDRLSRAYELLKAPSLALWLGRAYREQGKLVEAAELLLEATRLEVGTSDEAAVQAQAKEQARAEREALLPRIPTLRVQIQGVRADEVKVTLNGSELPNAVLGASLPTNPGALEIVGRARGEEVRKNLNLREGERGTVELEFEFVQAPPVQTSATGAEEEVTSSGAPPWIRPAGWVALGTGAAAWTAWAITGGMGAAQRSTMACPNNVCPEDTPDADFETYQSLRTAATVTFFVGAACVATGVTLLLVPLRKPADERGKPSGSIYVNATSAGLRGTF